MQPPPQPLKRAARRVHVVAAAQGPAISLAYEPAEARVMERPPRDAARDRLISGPLLRYSYLLYGVVTVRGSAAAAQGTARGDVHTDTALCPRAVGAVHAGLLHNVLVVGRASQPRVQHCHDALDGRRTQPGPQLQVTDVPQPQASLRARR